MENKLVKIGFSIFALVAVVFGFVKISNNLHLSFISDNAATAPAGDALLEETKQRITDTDVDGLSDWDELNTYGTSPYLADSDSDGSSDSEEIKNNTDPNCPTGKVCGTSLTPPAAAVPVPPAATEQPATAPAADENLTPDEIRTVLKQGGVTDEQLKGATDADLQKLFNETLNANSGN